MKAVFLAAAAALALPASAAFAQGGGGNPAIANQTTTSMGAPAESPGYAAHRSEVVPGLPPQAREAQEKAHALDASGVPHVDEGITSPVQAPAGSHGHEQTAR